MAFDRVWGGWLIIAWDQRCRALQLLVLDGIGVIESFVPISDLARQTRVPNHMHLGA